MSLSGRADNTHSVMNLDELHVTGCHELIIAKEGRSLVLQATLTMHTDRQELQHCSPLEGSVGRLLPNLIS